MKLQFLRKCIVFTRAKWPPNQMSLRIRLITMFRTNDFGLKNNTHTHKNEKAIIFSF